MITAIKKTISLPAELARDVGALARAEGKTLSAVIQDALRQVRIERRLQKLRRKITYARVMAVVSQFKGKFERRQPKDQKRSRAFW